MAPAAVQCFLFVVGHFINCLSFVTIVVNYRDAMRRKTAISLTISVLNRLQNLTVNDILEFIVGFEIHIQTSKVNL